LERENENVIFVRFNITLQPAWLYCIEMNNTLSRYKYPLITHTLVRWQGYPDFDHRSRKSIETDMSRCNITFTRQMMINPLKPKLVSNSNNSVRTSKRTPHFTITKINWLMLFKEIIAV
jgi:hypothetical protein